MGASCNASLRLLTMGRLPWLSRVPRSRGSPCGKRNCPMGWSTLSSSHLLIATILLGVMRRRLPYLGVAWLLPSMTSIWSRLLVGIMPRLELLSKVWRVLWWPYGVMTVSTSFLVLSILAKTSYAMLRLL